MASSQTTNYSLPQWAKSDRIQMSDFNSAMSTIDAALAASAAGISALQQASDQVSSGSFTGTGMTGTRTYSLGFKPKLLIVRTNNVNNKYVYDLGAIALGGFCIKLQSDGSAYLNLSGYPCTLTDDGFTLALNSSVTKGLDAEGSTLTYWAVH